MSLENITYSEKKATRDGFGRALEELGQSNEQVIALCADLTGSLKMTAFKNNHPDRFLQVGISEANMMGIAAGLATAGKIPFTGTFANFSTGRVYDQIRQSIAYSKKNVKICASHAGLTLGEDGATHQILEDIGLMRMLPGMTVINPCDYHQTILATKAIADYEGPVYLRFGRPSWPIFSSLDQKFEIGKGWKINEGSDITIAATGHMVWTAIEAAKALEKEGVSVDLINFHTIKPLDTRMLFESIQKTGKIVSVEEHSVMGGLGSAIAEQLIQHHPVPMRIVGVNDTFGESGTPQQLLDKYGLSAENIYNKAKELL